MSAAKHTPGPWELHTSPYLKFATVVIADVAHEIRSELSEHDARLIAAAPDLLEALQEMLLQHGVRRGNGASALARAAIAKATGAQS